MKGAVLDILIGLSFLGVLFFGLRRPKTRDTEEAKAKDKRMRMGGLVFLILAAAFLAMKVV